MAKTLKKALYKYWDYIGLLAIILYGYESMKTFFREGFLPGWDHPVHFVCGYFTAKYFFPNILGWDPYNNFGWVFNQYYNPGAYILVALIYNLCFGLIDPNLAYKLALLVTYVGLGVAVFFFVREITGSKTGALLAAIAVLTVYDYETPWLDAGLRQIYEVGMWPQRLGLVAAFSSLALYHSAIKEKEKKKALLKALWSAVFMGFGLLSHVMTTIGLVVATLIYAGLYFASELLAFFTEKNTARTVLKRCSRVVLITGIVGMTALAVSSFWLIPLLETMKTYHNLPSIKWEIGPQLYLHVFGRLGELNMIFLLVTFFAPLHWLKGDRKYITATAVGLALFMTVLNFFTLHDGYLGLRLIHMAVLFSVAYLASQSHVYSTLAIVSAFLFLGTGPSTYSFQFLMWHLDLAKLIPFHESFAYAKFGAFARFLLIAIACAGMGTIIDKLIKVAQKSGKENNKKYYASVFVAILLMIVLNYHLTFQSKNTDLNYPYSGILHFKLDVDYPYTKVLREVMFWIRDNVPDNTYVFVEDPLWKMGNWRDLPISHYFYLTAYFAKKPIVGGVFGTRYITHPLANTEGYIFFGQPLDRLASSPEVLINIAHELGITYFIVFNDKLIETLEKSSACEYVTSIDKFRIYKLKEFSPIAFTEPSGEVRVISFEPNRIVLKVDVKEDSWLYVRQVYYPGWHCVIDDKVVKISYYYPDIPTVIRVPVSDATLYDYKVPFIRIKVPKGKHIVQLLYKRITIGTYISAVALFLVFSMTLWFIAKSLSSAFKLIKPRKAQKESKQ